jgi:PAS domain S-box-containing protein
MNTHLFELFPQEALLAEIDVAQERARLLEAPQAGKIEFSPEDESHRRIMHCARYASATGQAVHFQQLRWLGASAADGIQVRSVSLRPLAPGLVELGLEPVELRAASDLADLADLAGLANSAILNSIDDALLVTEGAGSSAFGRRILYVNRAFERMTGYAFDEIVGNSPRLLQGRMTSEAEKERVRDAFSKWQPVTMSVVNYRKDGSPFHAEIRITPVRDETGWYTYWVAVRRDVTERTAHEQNRVAASRAVAVEGLASSAAHDINDQVALIANQLSLIAKAVESGGGRNANAASAQIASARDSLVALRSLTSELMSLSHSQAQRLERVDLPKRIASLAKLAVGSAGIELTIDDQASPLQPSFVDASGVSRIVNNLLINAMQAMGNRHGTQKPRISIALSARKGEAQDEGADEVAIKNFLAIRIADNGPGLRDAAARNLFSPHLGKGDKGADLGLFVAKANMIKMGGDLKLVESGAQGTIFELSVPLSESPGTENAVRPELAPRALDRAKPILLIDDQEDLCATLSEILRAEGFKVHSATTAGAALDCIQSQRYALIVCDLNLGGHFVTDQILQAAKSVDPEQAIAIMSGSDILRDERIAETLKAHPDIERLEKPFDASAIAKMFKSA